MTKRMKTLSLLLAALCAAGCQPRGGAGWSPSSEVSRQEAPEGSPAEDPPPESGDKEEEDGGAPAVRMIKEELEALAQQSFDDGLVTLAVHYTDAFEDESQLDISQMCWAAYQVYAASDAYREEEQEYPGYNQVSKKRMDGLIARWFGPGAPDTREAAKPEALGDPVACELVNYDEDKETYYIFDSTPGTDEQLSELKSAVAEGDAVTVRFNTVNADGVYRYTYQAKLRPDEDGNYYVCALGKGSASGAGAPEESGGSSSEETSEEAPEETGAREDEAPPEEGASS